MKCEGLSCLGKNEAIGKFHVQYSYIIDWGYSNYCQKCIDFDRQSGLDVINDLEENGDYE